MDQGWIRSRPEYWRKEGPAQADLELYVRTCGFEQSAKVTAAKEIGRAIASLEQGPSFMHMVIRPGNSANSLLSRYYRHIIELNPNDSDSCGMFYE
jgi:hypothetical protein